MRVVILGAAAAALLLWADRARAAIDESTGLEETDMGAAPASDEAAFEDVDATIDEGSLMNTLDNSDGAQRLAAFLYMLRSCEHAAGKVESGLDYFTFYGNTAFAGTSDHPVLTGEKRGVSLDSLGPAYVGKVSTAAGAYQITVPTWRDVREAGAWGPRLPDFSPASQDEAARRILMQVRALPLIESGNIQGAMTRASSRWASLPGSTAGQHPRTLDFALAKFDDGLQAAGA